MSRSFMAAFSAFAIKTAGYKNKVADPIRREKYIEKLRVKNKKPLGAPPSLYKCKPEKKIIDGVEVFYFRGGEKRKVIYLHGGAYCEQPLLPHFSFCDTIAAKTEATVMMPVYKKSPSFTFEATYEFLESFYKKLLEDTSPESILFMGDSSGGGLALAFCEHLKVLGLPQPSKMVLISPWVDISMETPFDPEIEKHDPSLQREFLTQCALNWAGGTDVHDYRLSPINGNLHDLPPFLVYYGTYEAFLADARRFRDKCIEAGAPIDYREYEQMNHCFPIYPIPEAKKAQKEIIEFILK